MMKYKPVPEYLPPFDSAAGYCAASTNERNVKNMLDSEKTELTLFSWTESNCDGFGDTSIGIFNDVNEIDLSDEQARVLIERIRTRLDNGEHVTLRIANEGE